MLRLRIIREERGESQKQIAELFGVAATTYGNWENGHKEMDYATMIKLADHFGVTLDYLFGHDVDVKKLSSKEQKIIKFYRNSKVDHRELIDTIVEAMEKKSP